MSEMKTKEEFPKDKEEDVIKKHGPHYLECARTWYLLGWDAAMTRVQELQNNGKLLEELVKHDINKNNASI